MPCLSAGFINENREFPRMTFAFTVDGVASIIGSLMGTSPVTAFIESASGIREGGRTGLTACVVGCYMFIALFFTPLLGKGSTSRRVWVRVVLLFYCSCDSMWRVCQHPSAAELHPPPLPQGLAGLSVHVSAIFYSQRIISTLVPNFLNLKACQDDVASCTHAAVSHCCFKCFNCCFKNTRTV